MPLMPNDESTRYREFSAVASIGSTVIILDVFPELSIIVRVGANMQVKLISFGQGSKTSSGNDFRCITPPP